MLFDTLKKDKMQAMKNHDALAKDILGIAINKCMLLSIEKKTKNEDLTDADTLQLIQKTIKELEEEANNFKVAASHDPKYLEKVDELLKQQQILNAYLPKQLTKDEIKEIISKLDDKSVPAVMKYFKANYAGSVDMKLVNQTLKEI